MDLKFKDGNVHLILAFESKHSVDIIQAVGHKARSYNTEVSSTLIIQINSKFIYYVAFPYQVLMEEEET